MLLIVVVASADIVVTVPWLVRRYDGFFLRTASYDIPAEDKSAFALEMDDVRVMLRDSSRRSLALVDELGKGTSAR